MLITLISSVTSVTYTSLISSYLRPYETNYMLLVLAPLGICFCFIIFNSTRNSEIRNSENIVTVCKMGDWSRAHLMLDSNKGNPGLIICGDTALIIACLYTQISLASKLISTGKANSKYVDMVEYTALMWICEKKLSDNLAFQLINSGMANPEYTNSKGQSAHSIAEKNGLRLIVMQLNYHRQFKRIHDQLLTCVYMKKIQLQQHLDELKYIPVVSFCSFIGCNYRRGLNNFHNIKISLKNKIT